jgi:hypothetical protein
METQIAINILIGAIVGIIGWFSKQLWDSCQFLKENIHNLEVALSNNYIKKEDFSNTMKRIETIVEKILDKLDHKVDK